MVGKKTTSIRGGGRLVWDVEPFESIGPTLGYEAVNAVK